MNKPEALKVLVPIDFSETSRRALAWAVDYALRAPCELHLIHVVEDHLSDILKGSAAERISNEMWVVTKQAEEELERMAPGVDERAQVGAVYRHITRGRPAVEILAFAERLGADMVVMGTHGRTGLAGLLVGSVAEKIVRHAGCPVVCVKPLRAAA
jgi:universal stress protein A